MLQIKIISGPVALPLLLGRLALVVEVIISGRIVCGVLLRGRCICRRQLVHLFNSSNSNNNHSRSHPHRLLTTPTTGKRRPPAEDDPVAHEQRHVASVAEESAAIENQK